MRKIAGKIHRFWLNVEPYIGPLGWFQGIIGTAVLAALTAFWSWVLSTIQAINALGWGVWLVLGLALAILSLVGAVLALAVRKMWSMHSKTSDAVITLLTSEPVTEPEIRPQAKNQTSIRPQLLTETPEERAAKHDLAIFVAEHVLPTYRAQVDLHQAIIKTACDQHKVITNLAWDTHKRGENIRQYIDHMKLLEKMTGDGILEIPLEQAIRSVDGVGKLHHALCSFPKWLAGPTFDYQKCESTSHLYKDWRARQDGLVAAFQAFKRDPRFGRLYDLSGWRRLGEGFETDA